MKSMSTRRQLQMLIIISCCLRLFIANFIEFGNDEVYYYTYALHLQWNYFDHPPGVALLIKLTTLNLLLTSEVFVRLGSIICAAAGTWLCFKTGAVIKNERTGLYAAILYNTSIYTSVIAGLFILPDSPQMIFWLASLYLLLKIIIGCEKTGAVPISYWLLFGLLTGLCIQCKVHGLFLWFGIGLYILIYNRRMLAQPWLYISFIITVLLVSPIVFWNIDNHFITWTYHSNRVGARTGSTGNFLQAFFGQVFYNNPVNVLLIIISIVSVKGTFLSKPVRRALLLTGLPIVIIVTIMSLFNTVLPHWSGPGFLTLTFISAAYLDSITTDGYKKLPLAIRISAMLIVLVVFSGIAAIKFYPGTLSTNKLNKGDGDFTLDLSGWKSFESAYSKWLSQKENTGYSKLKIASNKWFPASHIEYYVGGPLHTPVVGVGNLVDLHNFAWLNHARNDLQKGEDALVIIPGNYNEDVSNVFGGYFTSIKKLQTFIAKRNGKTTRYFIVYLAKNYLHNDEVHNIITHKAPGAT